MYAHSIFDILYLRTVTTLINARRMRMRVTVLCLSVCYQSPGFFSRFYDKLDIPACSSLVFLGLDFDKTVSFGFFGAFHGYFVVPSPYERFRILLVAITVTWSDTPACAVLFLPTQIVRSIADSEWRCRSQSGSVGV